MGTGPLFLPGMVFSGLAKEGLIWRPIHENQKKGSRIWPEFLGVPTRTLLEGFVQRKVIQKAP